jgi:hypothetical protein
MDTLKVGHLNLDLKESSIGFLSLIWSPDTSCLEDGSKKCKSRLQCHLIIDRSHDESRDRRRRRLPLFESAIQRLDSDLVVHLENFR